MIQDNFQIPVIGILTSENNLVKRIGLTDPCLCNLSATYVKFVECSGGKTMPVWHGQDKAYYERVISYTNGLIFPGGQSEFTDPGGYGETSKILYDLAIQSNIKGSYYPIMGICLGFEVLAYASTNGIDVRTNCPVRNIALPLGLVQTYKESRLFANAPYYIINSLKNEPITYNHHSLGLTEETFNKYNLGDNWRIISINFDLNGIRFISTMEHRYYPFYGFQYHPEKTLYEFKKNLKIPHTRSAIYFTQYLSNFFVEECLKNLHTFPNDRLRENSLMHNFVPKYTGDISPHQQLYLFNEVDVKNVQL